MNNTVDNWAVEIENFKIKFVHIAGKDNILVDTLSRVIDINPDVVLEPELKDYEFGCYAFETLPKAKSRPTSVSDKLALVDGVDVCEINLTYDNSENSEFSIKLPLYNDQFACLQENDDKIHALREKITDGMYSDFYFIKNGILYRFVIDNGHKFKTEVVPEELELVQSFTLDTINMVTMITRELMLQLNNEETCTGSLKNLCYLC